MDPAFRKAAEKGSVVRLRMLVAANPDIIHSVTPDELNTSLHIAASNGHVRFIQQVLLYMNNDAKLIVTENSDGDTTLHLAARAGHLEVVNHLTRYAAQATKNRKNLKKSLAVQNKRGNTPLHEAASNGHVRLIQHVLWDMNIDVGLIVSANSDGDTPSHLAVRACHFEVTEHLTRYPARAKKNVENFEESLTVQNKKGNTLLHEAASNGHFRFIKHALWDMKIDVGLIVSANSDGDTPLHLAVRAGHLEVVESLTRYAAEASNVQVTVEDVMPGQVAVTVRNKKGNMNIDFDLIVSVNSDGDTPLHLAVRAGHLEVVEHLIRYAMRAKKTQNFKEPVIMQNKKGNTLLHEAVIHGMYRVAVKLLEAAKEVALAGNEVVKMNDVLLILRNAAGHTPLDLAVKADSFEMIEMLIKCDLLE